MITLPGLHKINDYLQVSMCCRNMGFDAQGIGMLVLLQATV